MYNDINKLYNRTHSTIITTCDYLIYLSYTQLNCINLQLLSFSLAVNRLKNMVI